MQASAIEYVATRVAVNSVVTALTELGHYVFDADLACPSRRWYGRGDPCGIVITFPDDSLVGVTVPVVLAVKTPFQSTRASWAAHENEDSGDRSHADDHFRGFPANMYRLGRIQVHGPDARDAVLGAIQRLPDPVSLSENEPGDSYGDGDFDDLPF